MTHLALTIRCTFSSPHCSFPIFSKYFNIIGFIASSPDSVSAYSSAIKVSSTPAKERMSATATPVRSFPAAQWMRMPSRGLSRRWRKTSRKARAPCETMLMYDWMFACRKEVLSSTDLIPWKDSPLTQNLLFEWITHFNASSYKTLQLRTDGLSAELLIAKDWRRNPTGSFYLGHGGCGRARLLDLNCRAQVDDGNDACIP